MSDDDETPRLPPDTLAILQEFLFQQQKEEITENWQLSQFWYSEETTKALSSAVENLIDANGKVALISCPTLMQSLIDHKIDVFLFEYDKRFVKFEERFSYYDYKEPFNVNSKYHHSFDLIVADPPFLSEECLSKVLKTVNLVRKDSSRIILCTGAIMEKLATNLGNLKPCSFIPKHKNNLANEFWCYTNFGELPL